jgi:hypothetical protein
MTTLNVHVQRALSAFAIAGALMGAAYGGVALAHATPSPELPTINLTDIPDIDTLPVCHAEDCSDVVGQTGVWFSRSTGAWLLERGEDYTRVIVDDTVVSGVS